MADTTTAILGLTKPEVNGSSDTWGTKGNANFDAIDALFDAGPALKLAKGGTGSTTASGARTNLGLGSMATQAANSVAITGGSVAGITDLAVADGGTGASTAANARTNLGLGTISTQNSNSVSITGGAISGIADLTVADGGTGVSSFTAYSVILAGTTDAGAMQNVSGLGTAGHVLTSNGAGAAPSWQAFIPSGTKMLFQQTAAPTGWTKDTTHDNKALRVVTGSASSGGTTAFSTVFASRTVSGTSGSTTAGGTIGGTAITIAQMPLHGHSFRASYTNQGTWSSDTTGGFPTSTASATTQAAYTGTPSNTQGQQIGGEGGGQTHTHTFTGSAHSHTFSSTLDMAVQYVDLIIATKD